MTTNPFFPLYKKVDRHGVRRPLVAMDMLDDDDDDDDDDYDEFDDPDNIDGDPID